MLHYCENIWATTLQEGVKETLMFINRWDEMRSEIWVFKPVNEIDGFKAEDSAWDTIMAESHPSKSIQIDTMYNTKIDPQYKWKMGDNNVSM